MNMEYKLIMAVSGFPSLYDTSSLTYRDLNIRSDAWRQVAELVGVPESECRRKWKTLRDQHRRERQREKERRESGIGLLNYRPWRYSSILSFLNPFIDARAAGTNGWALDQQHAHLHAAAELVGCSTTTDTRSSDDDSYGFAVADATTTSSEFGHRKRPSSALMDAVRLKEAKIEEGSEDGVPADGGAHALQHCNMKELLQTVLHSVTTLASSLASSRASDHPALPPPWHSSRPKAERQEEAGLLAPSDEEEEEEEEVAEVVEAERCPGSPRPARRRGMEALLEEFLRRTEAREAQREREAEQKDDVTLFLLSLAPAMRRLLPEKQSWVRTKMQQFLHEAEFGAMSF